MFGAAGFGYFVSPSVEQICAETMQRMGAPILMPRAIFVSV